MLNLQVLLECCYIKMESSQWENWNHLFCRKILFLTGPHYQFSRWRTRYEADLVASVVPFISSSTVKMWTTTFVGKYQHLVGKYCQLHTEDDERWYFGNQNVVQNWLLFHYYILRWPCILFNIYIMVEAIASLY
jgi:hypothetical protein